MIETWIIIFIIIYIRNKFIQKLERDNIYLYQQYDIKLIFKHISIITPLLFLLFYLFLEYTTFVGWHYFLQYQYIIKTATLLSFLPLIITYKLIENPKYINNQFLSILTSPASKAGLSLWIGSSLNRLALYYNNNKMPTYPSISYWTKYIKPDGFIDGVHIIGDAYSNMVLLCNTWDLGFTVLSLGDVIVRIFPFIILYHSIKRSNKILTK